MKFSCERCGKKYATAESPAPGKVYKLKCKACGHVIVVKPPATSPGIPAAGARPLADGPRPTPPPRPAPDGGSFDPAAPAPTPPPSPALATEAARTPVPGTGSPPARPPVDGTTEITIASLGATPTPTPAPLPVSAFPAPEPAPGPDGGAAPPPAAPAQPAPAAEDEFRPPPGDTGYVDLFADGGDGHEAAEAAPPPPEAADPFVAAGASDAPAADDDPFASVRAELDAASTAARAADPLPPAPLPKIPEIPRPPEQRGTGRAPFLLIGAGVLVVIGILAFVLLRSSGPAPAVRAPVAAAAPALVAEPAPREVDPAPQATPEPPPVEVKLDELAPPREPPAAERRDRAVDRNRKRPERRPEPRPEPPKPAPTVAAAAPAPAPEPRREEAKVDLPEETEGLSPETVQKVLSSTRRAFDGCISSAKGSDLKLDGRKVILRLTINNSGAVTYPTLDDVTLNGTEMGACLKSAARLMVFPKFSGDPLRVEVPLTLAER